MEENGKDHSLLCCVFFTTDKVGHRKVEILAPADKEQFADEGTNRYPHNTTVLEQHCKYNNPCNGITMYTLPTCFELVYFQPDTWVIRIVVYFSWIKDEQLVLG